MSNNYGANAYKKASITTANRGQILIMLYEAAIRNLKKAEEAIDARNMGNKGTLIGKTHDIIAELQSTLNFDVGGDIAKELDRLYSFMTEQLLKANIENSKEKLQAVSKLLNTLLVAWRQAVDQANRTGVLNGAPPPAQKPENPSGG